MPNENAKISRNLVLVMMLVAFIGFVDSMYLTASKYFGVPLKCNLTHGCDVVTNSVYSEIFGIGVSPLGVVFYLTIFFGLYAYLETKNQRLLKAVTLLPIGGFLFSLWLTYVQGFILHAWCQYCLLSAACSTTLFVIGLCILCKLRKAKTAAPSP